MSGPITPAPLSSLPAKPGFIDAMNLLKKDVLLNLFSHHVGTIQSFNAETQTAKATVNYTKTYYQVNDTPGPTFGLYTPTQVAYPALIDCPVMFLGGGPAALTFPVAAGDECLCIFNDRDMSNWYAGNTGGPCASSRFHSISDAIILVGLRSQATAIQDFDTARAVLRNGSTVVGVGATLIQIQNATYNLNTLLQNLVTEIKNLVSAAAAITVTTSVPSTPGSYTSGAPNNASTINAIAADLTNTAMQIAGLLE